MNGYRHLWLMLCVVGLAGCASVPATAPDVAATRIEVPTAFGDAAAHRYAPAAGSARGTLVFVHGFLRGPARHQALALRLAREGFVVLLPDLPSPLSDGARQRDAALVLALLQAQAAEDGTTRQTHSPIFLGGFSRGSGIAADVAGQLDARVRSRLAGLLLIDPVTPAGALAPLRDRGVPVALLAAPPSPCNARGMSFAAIRTALKPVADLTVAEASHCDPESPSDVFCALLCGAPDPLRQAQFEDAMVRFILAYSRLAAEPLSR